MRKVCHFRQESSQKCILITIELLCIHRQSYFGLRITQFNQQNLTEDGCFLFIDNNRWSMSEEEKQKYGPGSMARRRTQLDPLIYHYKLVPVLVEKGFDLILNNLKLYENEKKENEISLEIFQYKDDKSHIFVQEDALESLIQPEMLDFNTFKPKKL